MGGLSADSVKPAAEPPIAPTNSRTQPRDITTRTVYTDHQASPDDPPMYSIHSLAAFQSGISGGVF